MVRRLLLALLVVAAALPLNGRAAGLALSDTRLIIENGRSSGAVVMSNTGSTPFLTKVWIEDVHGNKPENVMVVPPVSLSVPNKFIRFQVSILNPLELPQDRETIFYLHTHSTPGNGSPDNTLNIAYNTSLKVFYRPKGLSGTMVQAIESLKWSLKNGVLTATNDSDFNISIVTVGLDKNYKQISGFVIAPHDKAEFEVKEKYPKSVTVRWAAMDDYGSPLITSRTISNQ